MEKNNKIKNRIIVPEWKEYGPSLATATQKQKSFYDFWRREFEKGNFVDVNGNTTYISVYLSKVIPPYVKSLLKTKNADSLVEYFEKIKKHCKDYKNITWVLDSLIVDAYIYIEDFDNAWESGKKANYPLQVNDFINFKSKCRDISIDGQDLFRLVRSDSKITKFGDDYRDELIKLSNIFLDNFFEKHGINFIEYFYKKFDFENLTENDFATLKEFYPDENKFQFWKNSYKKNKSNYPWISARYLFSGYTEESISIKYESVPHIISVAIKNEVKRIIRESENILRKKNNLPRVGEGWINETALYYKIVELFPNQKIVQHGKPSWLSPQHIDIYFPDINLGIEYQGAQHLRPVDFFGGEEAFKMQQQRDQKKIDLCKQNKFKLLHVFENYDIENIKLEIFKIVESKSEVNMPENLPATFGGNVSNGILEKSIEKNYGADIWENGNNFYSKKEGVLKIPKSYKITRDYFFPVIKEIEEKRIKIKNNFYSIKKEPLSERESFLKFISKKIKKRNKLLEETISQLNQLNHLWIGSSGRNENNINLEEVKINCNRIIGSLRKLSKEWERCYLVETSEDMNNLREIVCELYEVIFREIKKFIENINDIILSAENISVPKSNINKYLEIKFDFTEVDKKLNDEIDRLKISKKSKGSGCLTQVAVLFMLIMIAVVCI